MLLLNVRVGAILRTTSVEFQADVGYLTDVFLESKEAPLIIQADNMIESSGFGAN